MRGGTRLSLYEPTKSRSSSFLSSRTTPQLVWLTHGSVGRARAELALAYNSSTPASRLRTPPGLHPCPFCSAPVQLWEDDFTAGGQVRSVPKRRRPDGAHATSRPIASGRPPSARRLITGSAAPR